MKKSNYTSLLVLLAGIIAGAVTGYFFKETALRLKPLGDLFLNLLFTVVVPMVFFSIASAMANLNASRRLGKILAWMIAIFTITGVIAAIIMIAGFYWYPAETAVVFSGGQPVAPDQSQILSRVVSAFTVGDFSDLLSKRNMLALIVFSLLVGLATASTGDRGRPFAQFLVAGNQVMSKTVSYVMWYAPVGLGAYFAYLVAMLGSDVFGAYARPIALYYVVALLYFFGAFSLYVCVAGGAGGFMRFWKYIIPASVTAWGTGSSVATIPVNLDAARKIGVPEDVREVVIPIGATIHMEGSCLGAITKIAVLFSIFHMPFSGIDVWGSAIGIAVLCGVVISGIPSGGMLGEMLIITLFGFPIEAMPLITVVGTLIDPAATMVNATGDTVSSMLVSRTVYGPSWMNNGSAEHGK